MDINFLVQQVFNSDTFKQWNQKEAYLASCFFMNDVWHIAFYSKQDKKITSFIVSNTVAKSEEDQVFQQKQQDIEELVLNQVSLGFDDALKIMDKIRKEMKHNETVAKKIIILQKLKVPLWNVTYILSSFNLLNAKINASTGEIIEKTISPLLSFKS